MNDSDDAETLMRKYNRVASETFHAIHKQVQILYVIWYEGTVRFSWLGNVTVSFLGTLEPDPRSS